MVQSLRDNMAHHKYNHMNYKLVGMDKISLELYRKPVYIQKRIKLENNAIEIDDVELDVHDK